MIQNISTSPLQKSYDVVVVGGAMLGSSVAWFLSTNTSFKGSILVIEKDPTYKFSSTAHTNSCIRQQFSTEINVKISQFGADFIKNFREYMGGDERVPIVPFQMVAHRFKFQFRVCRNFTTSTDYSKKIWCWNKVYAR